MNVLLLALGIFASTWLGVVALWVLLGRRQNVEQRLTALAGSGVRSGEVSKAATGQSVLGPLLGRHRLAERVSEELWRAGLGLSASDFLVLTVISGLLLGGLCLAVTRNYLVSSLVGIPGMLVPLVTLRIKQGQRRARLEAQLPDALALASSSLRSGYSFLQALEMIAREMVDPMHQEARQVLDEVSVGLTLDEALARLVRRTRSYDVDLLVTAITIQYHVGGNLAHLLDTISDTIRERFRARMEIAGLTAEGRLSGVILFCLPFVLLGVLTLRSPDYMLVLFVHPVGQAVLAGAFVLQVIGGLVIRRMLSVDA